MRNIFLSILFIAIALSVGCNPKGLALFKHLKYTSAKNEKLPYCLLKPQNIEKGERYPLVIFYHGSAARGDDNKKQLEFGAPLFVRPEILKDYPCFLIAPQCPVYGKWVNVDGYYDANRQPYLPAEPLRLSIELLHQIVKIYPVDTNRIYITGLSLGGFATWDAITRYPDLFAAAAPVCGGGDTCKAYLVKNMPIWVFHGTLDEQVNVIHSRTMVQALKKAGGHPLYTEYPYMDHNVWDSVYCDDKLLKWMFAQKKPITR